MKKILLICLILFISGCTKVYSPIPMDLGRAPELTSIKAISPLVSDGKNVTVELLLTPGSKYSLQVTNLLDQELKVFGFVADGQSVSKKLDLNDLAQGDYNIVLIDIKGNEIKRNITIKK